MFTKQLERKATETELIEAQQVYNHLIGLGLSATYAGGKRSKGQGFWVSGYGYQNCQDCLSLKGVK